MKPRSIFAALIALAAPIAIATAADARVIYASIPNLDVLPTRLFLCSACVSSPYEPLDEFTLGRGATITGFEVVTGPDFPFSPYTGRGGFTVEVYDSTHATRVFSQTVVPTSVTATKFGTDIIGGSLSGLHLGAGGYWIGFYAPVLGVAQFGGGNGSLIDTTPHTGTELSHLGGNTGYVLSAVPEPSTWTMLLLGFAGLGLMYGRGRRRARVVA